MKPITLTINGDDLKELLREVIKEILQEESINNIPENLQPMIATATLLASRVTEYCFYARTLHCFMRAGIKTLGDLVQLTSDDLKKIPQLGRKSLSDIKDVLEELDLWLGMDVTPYNIPPFSLTTTRL